LLSETVILDLVGGLYEVAAAPSRLFSKALPMLSKTGTSRQVELVQLLLTSAPLLAGGPHAEDPSPLAARVAGGRRVAQ
jgi:hypothetical protein